jgi:exodeoxyribonuclease VII large subunit
MVLENKNLRLAELSRGLHAISPLATLDRGYAIIKNSKTQQTLVSVATITVGDTITARISDGQLLCTVNAIEEIS